MNFSRSTTIITGASMGVGAATARAFLERGANVVLVSRGEDKLRSLAHELGEPDRVMTFALDVTDFAGCEVMLKATAERFGGIDILINNAGYHKRGTAESVSAEEIGRMVDVNLKAPLVLTRMALPYLRKSEHAAIIGVASLAGRTAVPGSATYSATKFGLRAFTLAMAEEMRDSNIKFSTVSPGPVDTGFIMDDIDQVSDLTFSQPLSTAEQVAEAIVALTHNSTVDQPMPRISGVLATVSYLFPAIGRALRPALERKGRRIKARIKRERGNSN